MQLANAHYLLTAIDHVIVSLQVACLFVGLGLHFFLIAIFCWQVVEGFSMFKLLVQIFNKNVQNFVSKAFCCCYAVALVVVGSSVLYSVATKRRHESITTAIENSYR